MSIRDRFLDQAKKITSSGVFLRLVSNDRVMKIATGVMDARGRLDAAWEILRNGHQLPNIDPALDEEVAVHVRHAAPNGAAARGGAGAGAEGETARAQGAPQGAQGGGEREQERRDTTEAGGCTAEGGARWRRKREHSDGDDSMQDTTADTPGCAGGCLVLRKARRASAVDGERLIVLPA